MLTGNMTYPSVSRTARGFTLIELLVVIAIIGILSSIVLASLNSARSKGNDAAIRANLATAQLQAEMYYDSNLNYGPTVNGGCNTAGGMFISEPTLWQAVGTADGISPGFITCISSGSAYAISTQLNASSNHWCVDSKGSKKARASAITTSSC